jgi:hypothetical protein
LRHIAGAPAHLITPLPAPCFVDCEASELLSLRNNKKKATPMFKHSKVRQAGLIVFATTLLLILPNMTRLFG